MANKYIDGKTKAQILDELHGTAEPRSVVHEVQKAAILVRCTEDLEKALDRLKDAADTASNASDRLGRKLFWLNVILTAATVVGAVATAFMAWRVA